jgi:acetaldehyde dehydrogenase/alcohol dehydrogenase
MARKTVDGVHALEEAIARVRTAQRTFSSYTQEQVDIIFRAAALAANKQRIPLAQLAVRETGMGVMEDKVVKNAFASEYIYNAYRGAKTCGVVEKDEAAGIVKIAEPVGVIAAVIPTTNPTSTTIFKCLLALKTRNGIIISPHPRAKDSTAAAAQIVLDAAVNAGAPEGIIDWIDVPGLDLTNMIMRGADLILATGGPGMVKSAYSSGKPAVGVGAGNVPAVIDDSADVLLAVNSIIHSKTFDNGMICASEQSVIALQGVYGRVKDEFQKRGCHILTDDEADKIRNTIFINGALNAKIVGQTAGTIAGLAGVAVPANTKILIGEVESVEISEPFAREKLSPVLALYKAADFDDALKKAERLVNDGGYGHTASVYMDEKTRSDKFARFCELMKTCRVLLNTPSSFGGIGDLYNFALTPSLTLGCGSWGGNSVSENVGVKHLLNIKTVAKRRENMLWFRTPKTVYIKRGCLDFAIEEITGLWGKKNVFVVTDKFLYDSGMTKRITDKLQEAGVRFSVFFDVEPDPTLSCAAAGAKLMTSFAPDCVIALGGGSAMDAAKIMWVLYEHPDADFEDMAARFADIRKRVYRFPKMGVKADFVAVPTTAGTGSEVTPFAVITGDTGLKYPLADYELLPSMAVVDADLMTDCPRGLTAASGIDALTHALEAYLSVMATDFTDALALQAAVLIFEYLPRAYSNGAGDPDAREKMANAATIAGMAFANAFLGVNHSMAHKLGSYHHLPHGIANALLICGTMRYNAAEAPAKMGNFPQYPYPASLSRYARMASAVGLNGDTDEDKLNALIEKIEELKATIGVKATIADYGVSEEAFLDSLDKMSLDAFDDQCTSANPRYPLVSEIKQMFLNAYYGRKDDV